MKRAKVVKKPKKLDAEYRELCRYYYPLDPKATAQYILFYLEKWDPEGLKKIKKRLKNKPEGI